MSLLSNSVEREEKIFFAFSRLQIALTFSFQTSNVVSPA